MAINPLFMPQAMSSLMGPRQEEATAAPGVQPTMPQLSPTAKYVQDMQRLLSGDIRQTLTGGEKLMALGALLRSAGRRSQTTPQEVMQNVRQTAQGRVASQLQLAQLQEEAARETQQKAFIDRYSDALPDVWKSEYLKSAPVGEAFTAVGQEIMRQKQVMQYVRDKATGKMRIEFQDGTSQLTDRDIPMKTKDRDLEDRIQVLDEYGEVIAEIPKKMSPYQAATLKQRQVEEAGRNTRARNALRAASGIIGKQTKVAKYIGPGGEETTGEVRWDKSRDSWVNRQGSKVTLTATYKGDPLDDL